jgi:hypothetical protein
VKGNSALPGGSLVSKPTWSNTCGCSTTSAFFVLGGGRGADRRFFVERYDLWQNNDRLILYGDLPGAKMQRRFLSGRSLGNCPHSVSRATAQLPWR